jgi:hypothetical protein
MHTHSCNKSASIIAADGYQSILFEHDATSSVAFMKAPPTIDHLPTDNCVSSSQKDGQKEGDFKTKQKNE